MKYKSNAYAKALMEIMAGTLDQQEKLLRAFALLLQKKGDTRRIKEITALASQMYAKKTGRRNIVVESARKVNTKSILKSLQREGDNVEEKITPDLVAGVKITVNGEAQLDFSLSSALDNIFSV